MGRYYRLSKKITEEMASDIMNEVQGIPDVEEARLLEENTKILVETEEEKYPEVMTKIVNIFARVGNGCEIAFAGFKYGE